MGDKWLSSHASELLPCSLPWNFAGSEIFSRVLPSGWKNPRRRPDGHDVGFKGLWALLPRCQLGLLGDQWGNFIGGGPYKHAEVSISTRLNYGLHTHVV